MKEEEKNKSDLNQNENNTIKDNEDIGVVSKKAEIKNEKEEEDLNDKKIKELEEKNLRSLAEMENQRRRFEKEREEAFEFGGFAFA